MKGVKAGTIDYVHHVPGRLRVCVRDARRNQAVAGSIAQLIRTAAGVKSVNANALTGSILIHYDPNQTSQRNLMSVLDSAGLGSRPSANTIERGRVSPLAAKIGPWLLGKTLEIAVERSVVLLVGALL